MPKKLVRFKREKNRDTMDVFKNIIQPKLQLALNDAAQKVVFYSRRFHTYQNRTGALENSISWIPAEYVTIDRIRAAVIAGGPSMATQNLFGSISFSDPSKTKKLVKKGTKIFVKYAKYVEGKGYPVLKQGIEHWRRRIGPAMRRNLLKKRIIVSGKHRNDEESVR